MTFMELAKERYSVRSFSDRKIEDEKLELIKEAGLIAPTAKNNQPLRIFVMKSDEAMEKMNNLTRCIYGAPTALLVCYSEEESWHNPETPGYMSGEMDASIALTHMMLEAWELGIGSCWVGVFDHYKAQEVFGLGKDIVPVAIMPLGYAAEGSAPSPRHAGKRPMEEIFKEL